MHKDKKGGIFDHQDGFILNMLKEQITEKLIH